MAADRRIEATAKLLAQIANEYIRRELAAADRPEVKWQLVGLARVDAARDGCNWIATVVAPRHVLPIAQAALEDARRLYKLKL